MLPLLLPNHPDADPHIFRNTIDNIFIYFLAHFAIMQNQSFVYVCWIYGKQTKKKKKNQTLALLQQHLALCLTTIFAQDKEYIWFIFGFQMKYIWIPYTLFIQAFFTLLAFQCRLTLVKRSRHFFFFTDNTLLFILTKKWLCEYMILAGKIDRHSTLYLLFFFFFRQKPPLIYKQTAQNQLYRALENT